MSALHFAVFVTLVVSSTNADEGHSTTADSTTADLSSAALSTGEATIALPPAISQARDRAKLLHEAIRGTLQVVHRDFFDEEDAFAIPSRSLEDVFHELGRRFQIELRWLNVQTDILNSDHQPRTLFEREAVKQLSLGKEFYEQSASSQYFYAGAIHLKSQCLKCHLKRRLSNVQRTAGLVITMPLAVKSEENEPQKGGCPKNDSP